MVIPVGRLASLMEIHLREIIPWEKQAASECPVMGMNPMHPLNGTGAEPEGHDAVDSVTGGGGFEQYIR